MKRADFTDIKDGTRTVCETLEKKSLQPGDIWEVFVECVEFRKVLEIWQRL